VIISSIFLWQIAEGLPVGNTWPYQGGTAEDIGRHLRQVAAVLEKAPDLEVDVDFNMFLDESTRSIQLYFCKRALATAPEEQQGLALFISSLAPVAAYCPAIVRRTRSGKSYRFQLAQGGEGPSGDWSQEITWITKELAESGFAVPEKRELQEILPNSPDIPPGFRGKCQLEAIIF